MAQKRNIKSQGDTKINHELIMKYECWISWSN